MKFTDKPCSRYDEFIDDEGNEVILNDCRDNFAKRDDITLITNDLKRCPGCGEAW